MTTPQRRVQVWFGSHLMYGYRAEQSVAERYAAEMGRLWPGLRVTVDGVVADGLRPLPCERLWTLAP
ncbi:hypothetical protein [Luteipulveratus mongoliensis]|uniref:Uncharacterized protein n=1 Tax=Luteipulveratus mongoliensis TaxID=571913 RepID=A0A0K1JGL6_9MICO|nr:hypothetical protein [Luteipulveratus mongoliensis]AKU15730.1 hypothetical protein VV02_07490 [Luteipulveratus mongoliensis]